MVSIRCKLFVKSVLDAFAIPYGTVDLGEVEVKRKLSETEIGQIRVALGKGGLELMDDKKAILIERIKNVIIEMVHYEEEMPTVKNSVYISQKLKLNYTYLANLFAEATGTNIEHFIILHKIEKVKELLLYEELSLTEISYKLNYSSVAHLSNQFKKITGLTPTFFRQMKEKKRNNLEDL
jgi:AraC-like DNA-binding protein